MSVRAAGRSTAAIALAATMLFAGMPIPTLAAPQETPPAAEAGAPPATSGVIRGSLVDANGQPLVGYVVKVTDATGAVHESEPTGPEGKFEINDLPPGTYTYSIFDPEGQPVGVKIPPVNLEAGTMVTQPIAIVPRKGKKGPLIAWLVGGGAAAAALIIAGNNNDDNDDDKQMTPSTARLESSL